MMPAIKGRTPLVVIVLFVLGLVSAGCSSSPPSPDAVTPTAGGQASPPAVVATETAVAPAPSSDTGEPGGEGNTSGETPAGGPATGSPAGNGDREETAPPAAEPAVLVPVSAPPPFQGLYLPDGIAISGDEQWVRIVSPTECSELLDILAAGEWQMAGRFKLFSFADLPDLPEEARAEPGPKAAAYWALLRRGEQAALVRAWGGGYCEATVDLLSRQTVVAQGVENVEGQAWVYPLSCLDQGDGTIQVATVYEGPGDFRASVSFQALNAVGAREIDLFAGDFEAGVGRSSLPVFDVLAQRSSQPDTEESEGFFDARELAPGEDFSGTISVHSTSPFEGEVDVQGLVDETGRSQDLRVGFRCNHVLGVGNPAADQPEAEQPETLGLRATLVYTAAYDFTSDGENDFSTSMQVALEGPLTLVAPNRYEGTFQGEGSGTFEETDFENYDGSLCTNEWTGSQQFRAVGVVSGDALNLSLEPAGEPQLVFGTPCNVAEYEEGFSFPQSPDVINGGGRVELAWPPGSPETDSQTIAEENFLEGVGGETTKWTVEFVR